MGVTIYHGLHPGRRREAALLYWEAFGGKLGRVMRPERLALDYFERVIRTDLCFAALDGNGRLIGIAGYKIPGGSFAGGGWDDLTHIYGQFGGRWRGGLLWALGREVDNACFLIDGISVTRAQRSKGIGSMLLAALCDEARGRGYPAVRLDVIDSTWRARALYERHGFVATRSQRLGLLRYPFGFSAATTMVRPLPA